MQEVGNIFGEAFPSFVKQQIEDREKVFGAGLAEGQLVHAFNDTSQTIGYLNYIHANSAYVKLVSSVDVLDTSRFKGTSLEGVVKNIKNTDFARQMVLMGGVLLPQSSSHAPYGYKEGESRVRDSLPLNSADFSQIEGESAYNLFNRGNYGFGGNEFGLRPMPGITSAVIEHLNEGAFRKATVKIKAYNRAQLEMIDALYLRIGFTALLEWGHTVIARRNENNTLQIRSDLADNYSLESTFLAGGLDFYQVADKIRANRAASQGNYDGFCGRIANYTWDFLADGTFDITIIMYSVGDVIESLTVNTATAEITTEEEDTNTTVDLSTPGARIEARMTKHDIGLFLGLEKRYLDVLMTDRTSNGRVPDGRTVDYQAGNYWNFVGFYDRHIPKFNVHGDKKNAKFVDTYAIQWFEGQHSPEYYIRFGTFLKFLEKYKVLETKAGVKIVEIDTDTEKNIIYLPDSTFTLPIDPRICIFKDSINMRNREGTNDVTWDFFPNLEKFKDFKKTAEKVVTNSNGTTRTQITGVDYGYLMNIYLNMDYILTTLDANRDSKTLKISAVKFLQQICDDISATLGGINKLNVTIDEDYNKLKIVDSVTFPNLIASLNAFGASTNYSIFNVYGFIQDSGYYKGSFVKAFSFSTQLSKDTSTLIGIGAAANSRVIGEDDTAFSKWNIGLKDRIWADIYDPLIAEGTSPAETLKTRIQQEQQRYYKFLRRYGVSPGVVLATGELDRYSWDEGRFEAQKQRQREILNYEVTQEALNTNTATTTIGFLPVRASITMKGLSGMKIYQIFGINADFLPANIPSTLSFLATNIKHTIENNVWDTTLETVTVPASVLSKGQKTARRIKSKPGGTSQGNPGGTPQGSIIVGQPVLDILIRFLQQAGIPVTEENKKFVIAWKRSETGPNIYNLFGTTLQYNGSTKTPGSSASVQSYKTVEDGITANVLTIKGRNYKGLYSDLKAGKLTALEIANKYATTELKKWGTGGLLAKVLKGGVSNLNRLKLHVLP